jgi:hypothetical protein
VLYYILSLYGLISSLIKQLRIIVSGGVVLVISVKL